MTTGYLLYKNATEQSIQEKLRRRRSSIVIPFLLWNTIYCLISILFKGMDNFPTLLYRFSFDPYDGPLWYLFAITLLSLASPIVIKTYKSRLFKFFVVIIMAASYIIYSFHLLEDLDSNNTHILSWLDRLCRYLPSYFFGSFIGLSCKENLVDKIMKKRYKIFFCNMILFEMVAWVFYGNMVHDSVKMLILFISPIMIWCCLDKEYEVRKWMRNSFVMYAIHRLVLTGITTISDKLHYSGGGGIQNSYLQTAICLIGPVVICIVTWFVAECFTKFFLALKMNKVLKRFNGGRI